ncbi:MAG: glycosyltransferase [candidate division KSB1 bacterium]|nr:glycosyltransferase [candidate division KSB1 bacterium]MDZ7287115.1 glycosyltransferase [candidate division KSB1 bacterium]MDZ7296960.1 glycosyltransferase [candidate division KSB1 bacterium]MDZ7307148.1 glycosyltransferase [candidate division KSB1 bacterium]MDZ7347827.1 glycosyltransferase [candidate division KSB1 bacterium]
MMGGREKQIVLIAGEQARQFAHHVTVVFQNPAGPNYEALRRHPGVHVVSLRSSGEMSLWAALQTLRLARQHDLAFLHSPRIPFLLGLWFARRPVIYRLSGLQMSAPRPFQRAQRSTPARPAMTFNQMTCPQPARSALRHPLEYLAMRSRRLIRWLLFVNFLRRRAALILVNSSFLKAVGRREYGVAEEKFLIVRNGLDVTHETKRLEKARKSARKNEPFTLGFIGRLDPRKRLDRLLQAVAPLVHAGYHLRVLIAGDGDLRPSLEQLARALDIAAAVEFLGVKHNPYEVLNQCDLFVLPSDNEAFSNAALEAMFAGVPVVVFKEGCGTGEIIAHRQNGFLVADGGELCELIRELSSRREECQRIGRQARQSLEALGLTIQEHVRMLNDCFAGLLHKNVNNQGGELVNGY